MSQERFAWWNNVRHGGLLLDAQRLNNLIPEDPNPLDGYTEDRFRRRLTTFQEDPSAEHGKFVSFVLEVVCGFSRPAGEWSRGPEVSKEWSQRMMTGESVRPRHLWIGKNNATFMPDTHVQEILELLSRTKIRIRQGRASTWMPAPVDFSSLDSEYMGILYEGLLDFELRTAPEKQPVVFLSVGNQPALPLATLEAMDDKSLKDLLEKLKDTSSDDGGEETDEADVLDAEAEKTSGDEEDEGDEEEAVEPTDDTEEEEDQADAATDIRHTMRARAETWARRACEVRKLVRKPRGKMTPEKKLQYEAKQSWTARHGRLSPAWCCRANGIWFAGAVREKAREHFTRGLNWRCQPCTGHCGRWHTIPHWEKTASRTKRRRWKVGHRSPRKTAWL